MRTGRLVLLLMALLLMAGALHGQEIRASVSAQRVGVGQEVYLSVLIVGEKATSIAFPDAQGFRKGAQDYRMVRGAQGEEHTYIQAYVPEVAGMQRLPAFGVEIGGRKVYMPSHFLEVVPGRTVAAARGIEPGASAGGKKTDAGAAPATARYTETQVEASLEWVLDKTTAIAGVPVPATVWLKVKTADRSALNWTEADLAALRARVRNPAFALVRTSLGQPVQVRERNVDYTRIPLHRVLLSGREPGKYRFEGIWLDLEKQWTAPGQPAVFRPWRLTAPYAELTITPLPTPPVAGADKAVGEFRMKAAFSQNPAKTGENTQLILDISGRGNTAFLPAPVARIDERNFIVYEPVARFTPTGDSLLGEGTRRFVYEVLPALHGTFDMGHVTLHYFNTAFNRYDSLHVALPRLTVGGKDKPDLIAARQLDSFYETVLPRASDEPPTQLPFGTPMVLFFMAVSALLAGWAWWKR